MKRILMLATLCTSIAMLAGTITISTVEDYENYFTANPTTSAVVEVFSPNCGWCQFIAPTVTALAQQYPQITFIQVNYQQAEALAKSLGVRSFPTFFFYKKGVRTGKLNGASKEKLVNEVAKLA